MRALVPLASTAVRELATTDLTPRRFIREVVLAARPEPLLLPRTHPFDGSAAAQVLDLLRHRAGAQMVEAELSASVDAGQKTMSLPLGVCNPVLFAG